MLGAGVEHELGDAVTDDLVREADLAVEQLGEAGPDRLHRVLGVGGAVGAPEVRGEDEPRAAFSQPTQGRQRRLDTRVVADLAALQRDVEVDPDEHASILDVEVIQKRQGQGAVHGRRHGGSNTDRGQASPRRGS